MVLMALLQVPRLVKREQYRELCVYGLIWSIAFLYAVSVIKRVPIPNPVEVIMEVFSLL